MSTPASRRVRAPLHEQGLCNGYGRGKMWLLRREADMRGAPRKEKRCQEPFRYASSLARNRHGQHGGPWSVNTRAWWHERAGQNRDREGGALGRVLPNIGLQQITGIAVHLW